MRILIGLTYYRPHYSGLTIYTERLARALAQRGHQVTVLTSQFDRSLPFHEFKDGVEIVRPWVLMRVSKGVIMPGILMHAWGLMRRADVVNLHAPQLDAAPISMLSRLLGKPVALTYHCDLYLPPGAIHRVANQVSHQANRISAWAADVIVTNTRDYAENSAFLRHYLDKVQVISPSVELEEVTDQDVQAFRLKYGLESGQCIIGMAARLATEKGVEYLVGAMPRVLEKFPRARVLFVGQYTNVLGEENYARKIEPLIRGLGGHWSFLGVLSPVEFAAFLHECDVTVLPSINSTESFGMVQVEAMTCGTPVVATDLPGVRQPVRMTGMGKVIPPAEAAPLAEAIIEILSNRERFSGDGAAIRQRFSPATIAQEYEKLFEELVEKK